MLTIANSIDPDYLIIEPTGIGMPANIISNLKSIEYDRISIMSPITIVDGLNYRESRHMYKEVFENQVKSVGTIIVSKTENFSETEKYEISTYLKNLNPSAEIWTNPYKNMDDSWWNKLFENKNEKNVEGVEEGELPDTFSIKEVCAETPENLILFLENLVRGVYGNIIRSKGCIKAGKEKIRFDSVGERYALIGGENEEACNAVFIGTNINKQRIRESLYGNCEKVKIRKCGKG